MNKSNNSLFSNKSSPKISISLSLYKKGESIIYTNKHLAQFLHHCHGSILSPTLQLLNTLWYLSKCENK